MKLTTCLATRSPNKNATTKPTKARKRDPRNSSRCSPKVMVVSLNRSSLDCFDIGPQAPSNGRGQSGRGTVAGCLETEDGPRGLHCPAGTDSSGRPARPRPSRTVGPLASRKSVRWEAAAPATEVGR